MKHIKILARVPPLQIYLVLCTEMLKFLADLGSEFSIVSSSKFLKFDL
jgi:hypothetical protein